MNHERDTITRYEHTPVESGQSPKIEAVHEFRERLDLVHEDVELLKSEIKQTLIDLRDVVMRHRTVRIDDIAETAADRPSLSEERRIDVVHSMLGSMSTPDHPQAPTSPGSHENHHHPVQSSHDGVISWVIDVRDAGLSPDVMIRFLYAYMKTNRLPEHAQRSVQLAVEILEALGDPDISDSERAIDLQSYGAAITRFGAITASDTSAYRTRAGVPIHRHESKRANEIRPKSETLESDHGQSDSNRSTSHSISHWCRDCHEQHDSSDNESRTIP